MIFINRKNLFELKEKYKPFFHYLKMPKFLIINIYIFNKSKVEISFKNSFMFTRIASSLKPCSRLSFSFSSQSNHQNSKKIKISRQLPRALREQVWLKYNGPIFEKTCYVPWCSNIINVFDFTVGHDVPKSKGGTDSIENLKPICNRCNASMSNKFTIREWNEKFQ